jgi:hypothetical protein
MTSDELEKLAAAIRDRTNWPWQADGAVVRACVGDGYPHAVATCAHSADARAIAALANAADELLAAARVARAAEAYERSSCDDVDAAYDALMVALKAWRKAAGR